MPKEAKEATKIVAEVEVEKNGSQNGHPEVEKKKLNKRERKEARQQKNGKSVKGAEKSQTQEQDEEQAGKKKKKDKKRKRGIENGEEQNGDETSVKKKKTSKIVFLKKQTPVLSCFEDSFFSISYIMLSIIYFTLFCFGLASR